MIDLLVYLLIFVIVAALVWWLMNELSPMLPAPLGRIVRVVVMVIMTLVLISILLGFVGHGPALRLR